MNYLLLRNSQKSLKSPIKSSLIFPPVSLFDNSPHCVLAINVRACNREIKSDIAANALFDVGSTSA